MHLNECFSKAFVLNKLLCFDALGELIKNFLRNNASQLTIYGYLDLHFSNIPTYLNYMLFRVYQEFLCLSWFLFNICSLFCLQDGLKERELCVFFRNNHFSTMFKVGIVSFLFFCGLKNSTFQFHKIALCS